MLPPQSPEVPYNFSVTKINVRGQSNQPVIVNEQIFKNRVRNGFFIGKNSPPGGQNSNYLNFNKLSSIEAGALNGEENSNSLLFELLLGWNGLLVEPNLDYFKDL